MTATSGTHEQNLGMLRVLVADYHKAFCNASRKEPPIPDSERKICFDQIYSIAKGYGFSPEFVDGLMDEAEKQHAVYETA